MGTRFKLDINSAELKFGYRQLPAGATKVKEVKGYVIFLIHGTGHQ